MNKFQWKEYNYCCPVQSNWSRPLEISSKGQLIQHANHNVWIKKFLKQISGISRASGFFPPLITQSHSLCILSLLFLEELHSHRCNLPELELKTHRDGAFTANLPARFFFWKERRGFGVCFSLMLQAIFWRCIWSFNNTLVSFSWILDRIRLIYFDRLEKSMNLNL